VSPFVEQLNWPATVHYLPHLAVLQRILLAFTARTRDEAGSRPDETNRGDIALIGSTLLCLVTLFRSGDLDVAGSTSSYAVAIPARNEERRIIPCLMACLRSMKHHGRLGVLVVVVNNTTDRTAEVAVSWAREKAVAIEILSINLPGNFANAGIARRLVMDRARRFLGKSGALLTTDADSLPEDRWISENLRQLKIRDALICGRIEFDRREVAALLPGTLESGHSETYYKSIAFELDSLLDPDPFNPWPHHGQISGASLAMRASAYDRVGGLPTVSCGEDRALAQAFRENDLPVVYCGRAGVVTSCRIDGRASGGMADTIASRMLQDDFACDEQLEDAAQLLTRSTFRSALRRAMANDDARLSLLAGLGLTEATFRRASRIGSFGTLWSFLERESPLLQRRPMFRLQLERETLQLQALLDTVRAKPSAVDPRIRVNGQDGGCGDVSF